MSPGGSIGSMKWASEEATAELTADYEVTVGGSGPQELTECIPVEWTDEERKELYRIDWQEPRNESSWWNLI